MHLDFIILFFLFFRLCPTEESQIQDQTRAWIYPKFQSFTSGIQKDDSWQGIAFENIDFWPPALAFTVLVICMELVVTIWLKFYQENQGKCETLTFRYT